MDNLVSVIIVTFNAGKTLEQAIKSVFNQFYKHIELIIIDGKSTDNTMLIIEKYQDNLRYISESDDGIYDAMNKGWKIAKGEWIFYLGSDDELLPRGIESLISNSKEFDIVYGNTILVLSNGKTKQQFSKKINKIKTGFVTCHQSIIMKKNVIDSLTGFDINFKLLADYDLVLRAYLKSFRFNQVDNFISKFSLTGTGGKNLNKLIIERHKIFLKNKAVLIPHIYTLYYFFKHYAVLLKHRTLDKFLFYK